MCVAWWGLGTNVKSSPPLPSCYLYCLRQACGFGRHWKVFPVEKTCIILHFLNPDFASLPPTFFKIPFRIQTMHILEVKTYFRHWKCKYIPPSTAMAAPPCRPNSVYIRKMGRARCKLEKAAQLQLEMMSGAVRLCRIPPIPHTGLSTHFCLAGHCLQ